MLGFLRQHALLSLVLAVALSLTLFFLLKVTASMIGWTDPKTIDQPIAGWMTPRYVARSWDVAPEVVRAALNLAQDGTGRRETLARLAADQGVSLEALIQQLDAAIAASRAQPND